MDYLTEGLTKGEFFDLELVFLGSFGCIPSLSWTPRKKQRHNRHKGLKRKFFHIGYGILLLGLVK